jgi:hypothetical protein
LIHSWTIVDAMGSTGLTAVVTPEDGGHFCCIARKLHLLANVAAFTHNFDSIYFVREGFMIAQSRLFQFGSIFATAISVSMLSAAADAYTPEQQQICTGDAFRLCGSDIPDVDRVTACMVRQRSQLSPGCRAFFRDSEPELTPVTARKPLVIKLRKAGKVRKPKKPH